MYILTANVPGYSFTDVNILKTGRYQITDFAWPTAATGSGNQFCKIFSNKNSPNDIYGSDGRNSVVFGSNSSIPIHTKLISLIPITFRFEIADTWEGKSKCMYHSVFHNPGHHKFRLFVTCKSCFGWKIAEIDHIHHSQFTLSGVIKLSFNKLKQMPKLLQLRAKWVIMCSKIFKFEESFRTCTAVRFSASYHSVTAVGAPECAIGAPELNSWSPENG